MRTAAGTASLWGMTMSERGTLHEWARLERDFVELLKTVSETIGRTSATLVLLTREIGRMGLRAWALSESKRKLIGHEAKKLSPLGRFREWLVVRSNYPPHLIVRNGNLQCSACGQPFSAHAKPTLSRCYAEHVYAAHRVVRKMPRK